MTPTVIFNYIKSWRYTEHAPWTTEAQNENNPLNKNKKEIPIVFPLKEWYWFKGDKVTKKKKKQLISYKQLFVLGSSINRQRCWKDWRDNCVNTRKKLGFCWRLKYSINCVCVYVCV